MARRKNKRFMVLDKRNSVWLNFNEKELYVYANQFNRKKKRD